MSELTLEELLKELMARHRALQDSFIIAKIQFRKDIPEEEGVLQLRRFIKRSDIVVREEGKVWVIFPHTPSIYASRIQERILAHVGNHIASIQMRVYPDDGSEPQDLLRGEHSRRVTTTKVSDAWDIYFATPLKVLNRAYTHVHDGQALAVKIQGHPWTFPGRLLKRFTDQIRQEMRVVDLSVLEGEEISFDLWKEFFAELTTDPTPRNIADALHDLEIAFVIQAPHLLPKKAFPFLRALWSALPSNASVLLLLLDEGQTYAHQTAFEQYLRSNNALIEIRLFPLSWDDFLHMAHNLLHLDLPTHELLRKYQLSQGYPSLLFPIIEKDDQFFYQLLSPCPEPVQEAIDRGRKILKPAMAQFLQTLSVLGPRFTQNFAQRLFAAEDPVKLRTFLERAHQEGWLDQEEEIWAFSPPLFWKELYTSLRADVRRKFHKMIYDHYQAEALENRDPLFLLQLTWHAWGAEEVGGALASFEGLLQVASDQEEALHWLNGFLEDFRDAPLPYPSLERALHSAIQILLNVGDPRAVMLAKRLFEQATGPEARLRALKILVETRLALGDWSYLDRFLESPQVTSLLPREGDFSLGLALRRVAAQWLQGQVTQGKKDLEHIQQQLFQKATQSRDALPLFMERMFAELHTLQAAFALTSGSPQKIPTLLSQAHRRAQPDAFLHFLESEIMGMWAFFDQISPPEGFGIQVETWRLWRKAREGAWEEVEATIEKMRMEESHSRYSLMVQVLDAWKRVVVHLEPPPSPVPGEPLWLSAFRAWLDAKVHWLTGKSPRWPTWDLTVDEAHLPAKVFMGMAQMVDHPENFLQILKDAQAYPTLRFWVLEWAGWLGIRKDPILRSLAKDLGSPWFQARARALLDGEGGDLMHINDQWTLKALEHRRSYRR